MMDDGNTMAGAMSGDISGCKGHEDVHKRFIVTPDLGC